MSLSYFIFSGKISLCDHDICICLHVITFNFVNFFEPDMSVLQLPHIYHTTLTVYSTSLIAMRTAEVGAMSSPLNIGSSHFVL